VYNSSTALPLTSPTTCNDPLHQQAKADKHRWLRKTGAFDKKPMDVDVHGNSGLVQFNLPDGYDEDGEETSPTPQPQGKTPGGKKRKLQG
jgi:hypothetical protein